MFSENRSLALLTYRLPPDCVVSWRVSVCIALPAAPIDCVAVSVRTGVTKRPAPWVIEPLVTLTWAELVALLSSSVRFLLFDTHRLPRTLDESESTLTNSGWLVA